MTVCIKAGCAKGFANTRNLPYYIQANIGATKDFVVPKVGDMQARISVINLFDRTYQIRSGSGSACLRPSSGRGARCYAGLKWEIPFLKAPPAVGQNTQ